ncbi:MAG TPA: L,D-transpeptidase [Actinomycetota bacterium]|nr:L,D-transpeptidase [Actinomycetota bacterium]
MRSHRRAVTALLLVGLFWGSLAGTASAAPIIQLDVLGLLGLRQPVQAPALAPVPPPPAADPALAAAPGVPPDSGAGRRVVYSVGTQRVWLVNEDESLHGSWLVSGRAGEPGPGSYAVFSRSRHARAKAAGVTMEFMVRFARTPGLPIGFHSIPVNRRGRQIQTVDELGSYQSLGCVRQRYEDAVVMWDFAQIGTPVIVLP